MSDSRTPIERMVDEACGHDTLSAPPPFLIRLRCPTCGGEKLVERHTVDPCKAVLCVFPCQDCEDDGNGVSP